MRRLKEFKLQVLSPILFLSSYAFHGKSPPPTRWIRSEIEVRTFVNCRAPEFSYVCARVWKEFACSFPFFLLSFDKSHDKSIRTLRSCFVVVDCRAFFPVFVFLHAPSPPPPPPLLLVPSSLLFAFPIFSSCFLSSRLSPFKFAIVTQLHAFYCLSYFLSIILDVCWVQFKPIIDTLHCVPLVMWSTHIEYLSFLVPTLFLWVLFRISELQWNNCHLSISFSSIIELQDQYEVMRLVENVPWVFRSSFVTLFFSFAKIHFWIKHRWSHF